jgi:hypothetical protein
MNMNFITERVCGLNERLHERDIPAIFPHHVSHFMLHKLRFLSPDAAFYDLRLLLIWP